MFFFVFLDLYDVSVNYGAFYITYILYVYTWPLEAPPM
jgi:hypothetical protein